MSTVEVDTSMLHAGVDPAWIACIDFGTAFSKAALVRSSASTPPTQDDVRVLLLGGLDQAGALSPLLLPSSIFVTEQRVFFGHRAEAELRSCGDPYRRMFASAKSLISQANADRLREPIDRSRDPSGTFTHGHLLRLLIAFVFCSFDDCIAETGVVARGKLPKIRLTRPAWSPDAAAFGEAVMLTEVKHGAALARTLGRAMRSDANSISVDFASELLAGAQSMQLENVAFEPFDVVFRERRFIPEPTAVAACYIRNHSRVFTIADIGAGTADFGAFSATYGLVRSSFKEHTSVRRSSRQAGDTLDALVIEYLAEKANLHWDRPEDAVDLAILNEEVRNLKRDLFSFGFVEGRFEGTLEEFRNRQVVKAYAQDMVDAFRVPFDHARTRSFVSRRPVHVVTTGGGGNLPFILDYISSDEVDDIVAIEDEHPRWVKDPALQVLYKQLAVAIGGALPRLPEDDE